ncbi:MAG: NUDIX domain-containing protein [Silicimonas sp.]|nr:NUDIX domain-containing protein [Silicimonas sp.]NNF92602.1 NUDIX domain-containing protein [Boseongicola sp.]RZW05742.1 MAG: NUDIX hydrolase [Paracoccaceae bacterium]MBT8424522.1 NUDIX domain-containing protein [Silicimonas sp.]NND19821.1 NUDIX domain-containing protein [Silicimonas sp.]
MTGTAKQIAALPVHWEKNGKLRVLMVTSRDSGRWVMPKGWLMDGKKPWRAAEIEALEEAGALGFISSVPVGIYHYQKGLGRGRKVRCRVTVYPMVVERLKRRWKERDERKRHWFSIRKAANLVDEDDLAALLRSIADAPEAHPAFADLRKAS